MRARRLRASSTNFGASPANENEREDDPCIRRRRKKSFDTPAASSCAPDPSIASTSVSSDSAAATSRTRSSSSSLSLRRASSSFHVECPEQYANQRTMTTLQEKVNAVTILPSFFLCLHYVLAGKWVLPETVETAKELSSRGNDGSNGCINWAYFPGIFSMPPPTVIAICLGVIVHCPWSFIYHWKYATNPNPAERLKHWSRRMDHSAIHAASICWSYSISCGSLAFLLLNLLYNADCIRCHWEEEIKPRRNQVRILDSMLLYTSPLLFMPDEDGSRFVLFCKIWSYFVVAVWCFVAYPIGGWSHAAFHIVMVAVPYLLLDMAAKMEAGGEWSISAAQCIEVRDAIKNR